jgi:multidrug efflux pump subunit AcrB
VILLSVVVLQLQDFLVPQLGSEFMPRSESAEFTVGLSSRKGQPRKDQQYCRQDEEILKSLLGEKVRLILYPVGSDNTSSLSLSFASRGENTAS